MIKDIIWDFDGTLFDTYPGMVKAFMETLREEGIEGNEAEILDLMKVSLGHAIEKYSENYRIEENFRERFNERDRQIPHEERPPYSFSREICREVINCGGRNFLITHRDNTTRGYLRYYEMEGLFTEIVTIENGFKRKPDPEAFTYLVEKYKLEKSKALGVGDRELDIQAAKNAGIRTCLFKNHDIRSQVDADFVISSLEELYKLIYR